MNLLEGERGLLNKTPGLLATAAAWPGLPSTVLSTSASWWGHAENILLDRCSTKLLEGCSCTLAAARNANSLADICIAKMAKNLVAMLHMVFDLSDLGMVQREIDCLGL
jgi:hypothetical protein